MRRLCILLTMLATMVNAAEWVPLKTPGDNHAHSVEMGSIYVFGDEVTYWRRILFTLPLPLNKDLATSLLIRERAHCQQQTLATLIEVWYNNDGQEIDRKTGSDREPVAALPGTKEGAIMNSVCRMIGGKSRAKANRR